MQWILLTMKKMRGQHPILCCQMHEGDQQAVHGHHSPLATLNHPIFSENMRVAKKSNFHLGTFGEVSKRAKNGIEGGFLPWDMRDLRCRRQPWKFTWCFGLKICSTSLVWKLTWLPCFLLVLPCWMSFHCSTLLCSLLSSFWIDTLFENCGPFWFSCLLASLFYSTLQSGRIRCQWILKFQVRLLFIAMTAGGSQDGTFSFVNVVG